MNKTTYTLLLGSNMGKRAAFLDLAELLLQREGLDIIQRSSTYETAAWGKTDQASFLNRVIVAESAAEPFEFLQLVKDTERILGRNRDLKWGPRTVDIDILFHGQSVINEAELIVPHPMMQERRFTLVPLNEIAHDFRHPVFNKSIEELLQHCADPLEVTVFNDQPVFPLFPAGPISYWVEMFMYRNILLELHENYPKQTFRNRLRISTANGILDLVVPVEATHEKTALRDLKISYADDWQRKHWRSISAAYQNSPFFEHYDYLLEPVFMEKYEYLKDFSLSMHSFFCRELNYTGKVELSSKYETSSIDLRNGFSPKKESDLKPEPYWQVFNDKSQFRKDMSILDLLFNLGPDAEDYLYRQSLKLILDHNAHS